MKYSTEIIERVADANNLVDIISQYTQLKAAGSGLMGRCPFPDHQEKTASFSVSESKQVYHCFGCGKSGNIFTFLKDYQGLSFPEAMEYLASRAHIALPRQENAVDAENKEQAKKKSLLKINKIAAEFFAENLKKASPESAIKLYLKKRGLEPETISTFMLGYASPEWESLVHELKGRYISLSLAEEVQLIREKSQGNGYYDLFKDRLMFPIIGPMGDVVAFGGRIIDQGQPKYLNSPETPVFTKGRVLYGLPQTAKYIRTQDFAIVVEGYMDLVSLYQAGIKNVVAIMGTALTADHAKLIKKLTRNVLVLLDGDQAGQTAAERSLPILLAADLYPKGYILPEGMDPDDFVKKYGANQLLENIRSASDLMSLVMADWLKNYRGEASEKVKFVDRVKQVIQQIPDQRLKDLYWADAAKKLNVDLQWIKKSIQSAGARVIEPSSNLGPKRFESGSIQVSKAIEPAASQGPKGEESKSISDEKSEELIEYKIKTAPLIEKNLVALAIKSRANFDFFQRENAEKWLTHQDIHKLLHFIKDVYGQDRKQFDKLISHLVTKIDEPQALFFQDKVTKSSVFGSVEELDEEKQEIDFRQNRSAETEDLEQKIMRDLIKRLKETGLKSQLKQLALDLKLNPTPEKIEQLKVLQKNISELAQLNVKSE